jgi:hypothetical protein
MAKEKNLKEARIKAELTKSVNLSAKGKATNAGKFAAELSPKIKPKK